MKSAIQYLRDELYESIDGGEECIGRDSTLSRWIELCDLAMGKPIDPWARRYHRELGVQEAQ